MDWVAVKRSNYMMNALLQLVRPLPEILLKSLELKLKTIS